MPDAWPAWLLPLWQDGRPWFLGAALVATAWVVSGLAVRAISALTRRFTGNLNFPLYDWLHGHMRRPVRIAVFAALIAAGEPLFHMTRTGAQVWDHVLQLAVAGLLTWLGVGAVQVAGEYFLFKHQLENEDNLAARKAATQITVLRRLAVGFILVLGLAFALMTFPSIRSLGAGLFASAGVAGLIAGLAARPVLSNLIAGLQIAMTQPIRIDDVVIVEGEWGWIEEIKGTFVVVRIWDLRRLVLPLSYFIERPFQNWTRRTADILGTVYVYTDYTVPVDEVREELHRILQATDLWDGKVWRLHVTRAGEQNLEMRALMSAPNSPQAWELRCHVRERLVAYLQREHPRSLVKVRAELS